MTHYGDLKRLIFAIPSLVPKEVVLAIEELERRIEELEKVRDDFTARCKDLFKAHQEATHDYFAYRNAVEDAMKEMDTMSMIDRSFDFSNGFAKALAVLRFHLSQLEEPKP